MAPLQVGFVNANDLVARLFTVGVANHHGRPKTNTVAAACRRLGNHDRFDNLLQQSYTRFEFAASGFDLGGNKAAVGHRKLTLLFEQGGQLGLKPLSAGRGDVVLNTRRELWPREGRSVVIRVIGLSNKGSAHRHRLASGWRNGKHRTPNIEHRRSNVERRTSKLKRPKSRA